MCSIKIYDNVGSVYKVKITVYYSGHAIRQYFILPLLFQGRCRNIKGRNLLLNFIRYIVT